MLRQINPVHTLPIDFLKISFNIMLSSLPRSSSKWSLPFNVPTKTLYAPLLSPRHSTCCTHLTRRDLTIHIKTGQLYKSYTSSLCHFLQPPAQYQSAFSISWENVSFSRKTLLHVFSYLSSPCMIPNNTFSVTFIERPHFKDCNVTSQI